MPVDMQYQIALSDAKKQSREKREPVAVIRDGEGYACINAYAAASGGFQVYEVVSEYHGIAII
jgi:hypothetical protein